MTRSGRAPLWAILGFQGVWKSKFEKIVIFVRPSLMFSNEIETSGGHISGITANWEVPLGFWMPLVSPFKNTSKLEKCQKSREISILGRPSLRFLIKIETSGGHISGTTASWKVPLGFWMSLSSPFKNTSKLEKCQKSREIAFFWGFLKKEIAFFFGRPSLVLSTENWNLTRP